jgi:ribosome-binding ATPase YchF (GTP1/OBG family)
MALEVGIVGLPGAGKTTIFNALTKAGAEVGTYAGASGKEHIGVAEVADERLQQLAVTVKAKKVTKAAIRVVDVPGTGPALLGNLRQVDAILAVLGGFSADADPARDLETLELELLVADRDHVEHRLERMQKQAKSGDAAVKKEVATLERLLAHLDEGNNLRDWPEPLPPELDPLTTKTLIPLENGRNGIDGALELELAELSDEEAEEFREGKPSALGEVVQRLFAALDLICFFTAGEKETRAWTLRRGETAIEAAGTIHSDIARGFIRCEVIRWDDLVASGSHTEAARKGLQRLEGKTYVIADGDVLNIRFNV